MHHQKNYGSGATLLDLVGTSLALLWGRSGAGELVQRAGVVRITVARMETLAKGDMSVSVLLRLLEAAG